jgi:hypothetical protein
MLPRAKFDYEVADIATSLTQMPTLGHMTVSADDVQQPPPRGPHLIRRLDHVEHTIVLLQKLKQRRG